MRDIRKDIKERINAIRSEQEFLLFRVKELDKKVVGLETLLEEEEKSWRDKQPSLPTFGEPRPIKARSELGSFLLSVLGDGKSHNTEELVGLVQSKGIPIKGKSPRRAVHFSLVGMKQNKLVEMVSSRVWKIAGNGSGEVRT
jgi:hypothetical protein